MKVATSFVRNSPSISLAIWSRNVVMFLIPALVTLQRGVSELGLIVKSDLRYTRR